MIAKGKSATLIFGPVLATLSLLFQPAAPTYGQCPGDCNGDQQVTVDELLCAVNVALGAVGLEACCSSMDLDENGSITVNEIITLVNYALVGCPVAPTPTLTRTDTPGETPTTGAPSPSFTATPTVVVTETPSTTPASPLPTPVGSGVKAAILSAGFTEDGTLNVVFTLTDDAGLPLTPVLSSTQDPQRARVRFTLARIEEYNAGGELQRTYDRYVNEINRQRPGYDSGGTLSTIDAVRGLYQYTFRRQFSPVLASATYTVGLQVDRVLDGVQRAANPVFDFVPEGREPNIRAGTTTEQCNSCHDPLVAHGNRREVRLCTLCHTQEAVDERGRSVDFGVMVHKIHRGKELPSIVNGPPGTTYALYSSFQQRDIVFARKEADGRITGVGFPRAIENCSVCHGEGPTAEYHLTRPSAAVCSACHDDVNPSDQPSDAGPPGTNHLLQRGFADGDCSFCHEADSGKEFDVSVVGAHVVPLRSRQLQGLRVQIAGLENHEAGQTPIVTFRVTNGAGEPLTTLSGLNRLGFALSGPTRDYQAMLVATAAGGGASGQLEGPDDTGLFRYEFPFPIPSDASGTWALGAEARRQVTLGAIDPIEPKTVQEAAPNPVVTFSVDGSQPLARREVVADSGCGSCHGELSVDFSVHGNLRNSMEYCALCHNPNQTDVARRRRDPVAVEAGLETASIDFKVLIHKIHTGEELNQKPFYVYGFGLPPQNFTRFDFSEVLFPGDRRNCEKCHLSGTYLLPPFPGPALGTRRTRLDPATGAEIELDRIPPITAVCTSCHDSTLVAAHAETQTTSGGAEACLVCHAEGRSFPVSAAHARRF